MSQRTLAGLFAILALIGYLCSFIPKADAIPAFARKYDTSCNTCHVSGFPKLNDFGNRFRDRGYQMDTDDDLPTGLHMGYWPVSLRTTVGYQGAFTSKLAGGNPAAGSAGASTGSFGFTGLDLLAFGSLAKDIAFGVIYVPGLGSAGFGTGGSDGDLEAAFVRFNNLFSTSLVNVKVGKFELDLPFSEKRSPTLNTPFVMYHYISGKPFNRVIANPAGNPTYANANDFGLGDNQQGMELFGTRDFDAIDGTLRYSLNAVSSSASNVSGAGGGRAMQFYGHVTQSFGGYGIVDGQRIGLFGMAGRTPTVGNAAIGTGSQTGTGEQNKTFTRMGVDFSLTAMGTVNIFGAYMIAHDSKALFSSQGIANPQVAKWTGGFVEADYNFSPPWVVYYRYDWIRNTVQGDATFDKRFGDVDSQTVAARYHLIVSKRTAVALHAELSNTKSYKTGAFGDNQISNVALVGADLAF
ncbi:MAG: hypothetical protein E8D51_10100 [Nitrospira sp.]|nr:MAG: hypothetical protein E8D51_10100 [Nitrospira sp.]